MKQKPEEKLFESFENIKYDKFIKSCENSWQVLIAEESYYFPYSLCDIDEISKVILCPLWLIIQKGLEAYIDN